VARVKTGVVDLTRGRPAAAREGAAGAAGIATGGGGECEELRDLEEGDLDRDAEECEPDFVPEREDLEYECECESSSPTAVV